MIDGYLGCLGRILMAALVAWMVTGQTVRTAAAQGIAMVTDVSGRVGGPAPITIMSELATDARVDLAGGASLTVIYLKSGEEYTFSGPAQIRFGAAGPQTISGAPPQKRASPVAGGGIALKPVPVRQAAFVMRSARPAARIKLLTLTGTRTLEVSPEFRWQELDSGLTYGVQAARLGAVA
jgi:hypothetical protein